MSSADRQPRVAVAIDGPAASGKSSTARRVAERLGFVHVDSGALYRAATAAALRVAPDPDTWTEGLVLEAARAVGVHASRGVLIPTLDGRSVEQEIRGAEVTRHVSRVARMASLRAWVDAHVRAVAAAHDVVVDGRDIGRVVLPDAAIKVFLVADPWERARRRLLQRGHEEPTRDAIAEETDRLVRRDAQDALQTLQASDAVLIDTTYLTQQEQVDRIVALARAVSQRPGDTSPIDAVPRRG